LVQDGVGVGDAGGGEACTVSVSDGAEIIGIEV
jgi:hypothetical protein